MTVESVLQFGMMLFNLAVIISGISFVLAWSPLNYGCEYIPKKFLLGLLIFGIGSVNMLYLWLA
jgi:hypothetical protein